MNFVFLVPKFGLKLTDGNLSEQNSFDKICILNKFLIGEGDSIDQFRIGKFINYNYKCHNETIYRWPSIGQLSLELNGRHTF